MQVLYKLIVFIPTLLEILSSNASIALVIGLYSHLRGVYRVLMQVLHKLLAFIHTCGKF